MSLRWMATAAAALLTLATLTGCSDACTDLADQTCKRVGQQDPLCAKLRAIAAEPKAGDQEACKAGVAFVRELERR
ncbi:MAG: hypothetical protein ACOYOB_08065 [Myxococcota bacterium]